MTGVQGAETARATKAKPWADAQGTRREGNEERSKAAKKERRSEARGGEKRRKAERKGTRRREKAQGGEKGATKQ